MHFVHLGRVSSHLGNRISDSFCKNGAMAHLDSPEFAVTAALSRFLMGLSFTIALVLVDYSHGADIINKKRLVVMKVAVKHCCVVPRSRCLG